jgi:hypothetical protein
VKTVLGKIVLIIVAGVEHFNVVGTILSILYMQPCVILTVTMRHRCTCYLHLMEEETEAYRREELIRSLSS